MTVKGGVCMKYNKLYWDNKSRMGNYVPYKSRGWYSRVYKKYRKGQIEGTHFRGGCRCGATEKIFRHKGFNKNKSNRGIIKKIHYYPRNSTENIGIKNYKKYK